MTDSVLKQDPNTQTRKMLKKEKERCLLGTKHIKGSEERLFILTQTHNLQVFGVIPFVKLQNNT